MFLLRRLHCSLSCRVINIRINSYINMWQKSGRADRRLYILFDEHSRVSAPFGDSGDDHVGHGGGWRRRLGRDAATTSSGDSVPRCRATRMVILTRNIATFVSPPIRRGDRLHWRLQTSQNIICAILKIGSVVKSSMWLRSFRYLVRSFYHVRFSFIKIIIRECTIYWI